MSNINNFVLIGTVKEEFVKKRMGKRGDLMVTTVETKRMSGAVDEVIVAVPLDLMEDINYVGEKIFLEGSFVSYNEDVQNGEKRKSRLVLYAFARTFYVTDDWVEDRNDLELEGYICKSPVYREKESGYKLTDLILANNEETGASNYIPSICWANQATKAKDLKVGSYVHIMGRIQSRPFYYTVDGERVERTAFENSIWRFVESRPPKGDNRKTDSRETEKDGTSAGEIVA